MTTPQQQIIDKCNSVFAKAKELFPHLNFDNVKISFNLKGRAAGRASWRGHAPFTQYAMAFNSDMFGRDAFDHLLNNTVSHEIAHICCFMDPRLGNNHNSGWARVCTLLGGNGARYHTESMVHGKGYTYDYITDRGHTIRIGDKYHKDVQGGRKLTFRNGRGSITKSSQYSIVGHRGRTLAEPIVCNAQTIGGSSVTVSKNIVTAVVVPKVIATVDVNMLPLHGESKADTSRRIMLVGHRAGKHYEAVIAEMIAACGFSRSLARAYYKNNAAKIGIPVM